MNEILLWTLIVVNGAAGVSSSTYQSKALCEDALSIARTGMTVAEKAESDRKAKEDRERAEAEWNEKNPPRRPQNAEEMEMCKKGYGNNFSYRSDGLYCDKDWMIRKERMTVNGVISMASYYDPAKEVKYAKCVMAEQAK